MSEIDSAGVRDRGQGRWRRYPAYQDSGVEWLGDIPAHWRVEPLFTLLHERQERNPGTGDEVVLSLSYGRLVPRDVSSNFGLMPASFETYQYLEPGDIILRLTDLQNDKTSLRVGRAEQNGIITSAYTALRSMPAIEPAYAFYVLNAYDLMKAFYNFGAGVRQTMDYSDLKWFPIVLPPGDDQRAIAAFLDRETAKIDALVAKKERLIALLQEQRTALISHAVTKGLDPNAPMKDSGVEWLGEIPAHWEVNRLKHLASVDDEALPEDTDPQLEITYVDIGNVDASWGIVAREQYPFSAAPSRARRVVRDGDVIVSTVRTYLRAIAPIFEPEENLIVSTGFAVVRPRSVDSRFAAYALRASYFVDRVVAHSVGVSYPAISSTEMMRFRVAYPPLPEQRAIAALLDRETARIDALVAKVREGIERLKEYRTALISAAVAGKIDVRGLV